MTGADFEINNWRVIRQVENQASLQTWPAANLWQFEKSHLLRMRVLRVASSWKEGFVVGHSFEIFFRFD